jgi:hypothetical protein
VVRRDWRFVVRFVVRDLWSEICGQTGLELEICGRDLWSDGTGTLLEAVPLRPRHSSMPL